MTTRDDDDVVSGKAAQKLTLWERFKLWLKSLLPGT